MQHPCQTGSTVLTVSGAINTTVAAPLCLRLEALLTSQSQSKTVACDVTGLVPDLAAVNLLARLQLTAARLDGRILLRNASSALRALIELAGLSDVLPLEAGLGLGLEGQAEEREQPGRVEEEGDAADPSA